MMIFYIVRLLLAIVGVIIFLWIDHPVGALLMIFAFWLYVWEIKEKFFGG